VCSTVVGYAGTGNCTAGDGVRPEMTPHLHFHLNPKDIQELQRHPKGPKNGVLPSHVQLSGAYGKVSGKAVVSSQMNSCPARLGLMPVLRSMP
jgi:hypothetical protein